VKGWLGSAELTSGSVVGVCRHLYSLSDLANTGNFSTTYLRGHQLQKNNLIARQQVISNSDSKVHRKTGYEGPEGE